MRDSVRRKKTPKGGAAARSPARASRERIVTGIVSVLLVGIVWIVFGQTLRHEFVNYDDDDYVCDNPRIKNGLTLQGIGWAFTHVHAGNWHPLTTISHMLDCQLYGLQPWGHHLTNVLLHAAAAIFLFLALRQLTCAGWPSAFVAAVFAIHPLRVESVAWVAERKDVLSGMFFMLTLWAYACYVRSNRPTSGRYLAVVILYALGIMCKPTLVTLPFVLLLLDYWPLRRFALQSPWTKPARSTSNHDERGENPSQGEQLPGRSIQYLLVEKIPFFVLSAASCTATLLAQGMTAIPLRELTFGDRVGNALISYVTYLGQMIWPANLSVFYPYPVDGLNTTQALAALIILLIISAAFFRWRNRYAFLWIGWLWFLAMLVPMIGIVQVGVQARADRYTYLAQIGLYLLVTWSALELFGKWRRGREALIVIAVLIGSGLTADSYFETRSWRDGEALWNHALAHTSGNDLAHSNLADALMRKGRLDEAIVQFHKAIEIFPDYSVHNTLGDALMKNGQLDEAIVQFQKAIELYPGFPVAHANLGNAFLSKGNLADAIACFRTALGIRPDFLNAHNNLGISLAEVGKTEEALTEFRAVLRIDGDYRDAHCNLATLLLRLGRRDEAVAHLVEAWRLKPDDAKVQAQLRELGVER